MADQNNNNNSNNNDNNTSDTITVTGKPSTGQAAKFYEYKEYTKTWKNYCPLCGKSGKLSDNPKGVAEGEITCDKSKGGCDADYDICTGGDKSGKYRAYLQDASGRSNTKDSVDTSIGGEGGGTSGNTSSSGTVGSAIQIEDQTFYGLIQQMIRATDSTLITSNNMAYLLSYVDLHKYRTEYEEFIPTIKPTHILKDSIVQYWTTEGLYNAVEVTYKEGTIRYQHDLLVQQYGDHTYYCEFKDDDEETAVAKAKSLLSAHVRDYSLDLQLNCIYNPHITVGSWVKIPKNIINVKTNQQQEPKQPIKAKRHGVDITNLNQTVQQEQNGKTTIIQEITTKDKKTIKITEQKTDYEIYYVQGYKYRWTKKHSPIMNVHLKYGPDTPEDPSVATIGVGGGSSGGGAVGGEGITQDIIDQVNQIIGNEADPLRKATLIHEWLRENLTYTGYDCMRQKSPSACLASKHINCADTSQLTWAMMTAAGLQAEVVHGPHHFWTVITINGQEYASDATSHQRHLGDVWKGMSYYAKCGSKPSC